MTIDRTHALVAVAMAVSLAACERMPRTGGAGKPTQAPAVPSSAAGRPRPLELPAARVAGEGTAAAPAAAPSIVPPAHRRRFDLDGLRAPLRQRLPAATLDDYGLSLRQGEFVHLRAVQRGVDLVVEVFDPARREILAVDSPNESHGPEDVFLAASTTGRYSFRMAAAPDTDSDTGPYSVEIVLRRQATARDRLRAEAEEEFHHARALAANSRSWQAATGFAEAARRFQQVGEGKREADSLVELGQCYSVSGQPWKALALYQEAEQLYGPRGDRLARAILAGAEGVTWSDLGRAAPAGPPAPGRAAGRSPGGTLSGDEPEALRARARREALAAYRRALDLWQGVPFAEAGLGGALNRYAHELEVQDESAKALEVFRQALATPEGAHQADWRANVLMGAGNCQVSLGAWDEAEKLFLQALRKPLGTSTLRVEVPVQLANTYLLQSEPEKAYPYLLQATRQADARTSNRAMGELASGLGFYFRLKGGNRDALEAYNRALRSLQAEEAAEQSAVWINRGLVFLRAGDARRAEESYGKALSLARSGGSPDKEATARMGLASAAESRGNLIEARKDAEQALGLVESLRSEVPFPNLRVSYLATRANYYQILIDILMEQHALQPHSGFDSEALRVSESSRARGLLDQLGPLPPPGGPPPVQDPERLSRELLDDQTLVLEYHLGEPRSFLWVLSRDQPLASVLLPPRSRFEQLVPSALRALGQFDEGQATAGDRAALKELGELLLSQVAPRLGRRRLLIAPGGALETLPFAALPDPAGGLLVEHHEIEAIPSLTVLAGLRRRELSRVPHPFAIGVLADPVYATDDPRLDSPYRRTPAPGSDQLPRLPGAGVEASAIARLAPPGSVTELARGFEANLSAARSPELSRVSILHIASHARSRTDAPQLSSLTLSRLNRRGLPIEGELRAGEIERLKLNAELVVLSACGTAQGKQVEGEGLVGLPQSFFKAGAQRLLASLWEVSDAATGQLMERFYHHLLGDEHMPPGQALRSAQLDLRANPKTRSPYYWAAFVLEGDFQWRPLPPRVAPRAGSAVPPLLGRPALHPGVPR